MAGRGKDDNCLKVLVAVIITSSKLSIFVESLVISFVCWENEILVKKSKKKIAKYLLFRFILD
jgi:hypothetical protein